MLKICCSYKGIGKISDQYEIDYKKILYSNGSHSDIYVAIYKNDKQKRLVERIIKSQINLKKFTSEISNITSVFFVCLLFLESSKSYKNV